MMKEEVRGGTDVRRLKMRKNPVYSRIVPELLGQVIFLRTHLIHHQTLHAHILASSNYRHMQYVAYI